MRDRELYQRILGIEAPWKVVGVKLDSEEQEVRVHAANVEQKLPCPVCGRLCRRYDSRPRWWRHLDTCQFRTMLVAEVPRTECEVDGVLQVKVPCSLDVPFEPLTPRPGLKLRPGEDLRQRPHDALRPLLFVRLLHPSPHDGLHEPMDLHRPLLDIALEERVAQCQRHAFHSSAPFRSNSTCCLFATLYPTVCSGVSSFRPSYFVTSRG